MALQAFAAPILPGKTDQWKRFIGELRGPRLNDFVASRQRLGVRERTFLQSTPQGDVVLVTLEGDNPIEAFKRFATGNDPFTKWFVEQVKEIHGLDLTQMASMPFPPLLIDSEEARSLGK